jgi:hypothetical protein
VCGSGQRGILQGSFWLPDQQGMVCATDAAFMSTSLGEATPIHYMARGTADTPKPNVLWEIEASAPDDTGYHAGAEVKLLSQFAGEDEGVPPRLTSRRRAPFRTRGSSMAPLNHAVDSACVPRSMCQCSSLH